MRMRNFNEQDETKLKPYNKRILLLYIIVTII